MYCHASDHDTEECPTLLGKIQEKRNQNNQNVQWISAEVRDEGRNINIVTHGGAKTGNDAVQQEPVQHQWVKKNVEPRKQFDMQNEKEIFKQARQEFLKPDIPCHLNRNIVRKYQSTRCLHHWIIPKKCSPWDK
jgi:hypothetical protein